MATYFLVHTAGPLTWFEMDSLQLVLVKNIAADTTAMNGYAEAVLALLGDSSITRIPEPMPEFSGRMGQNEEVQAEETKPLLKSSLISVYPNPFYNSFTVEYSLVQASKELRFEIFDLTGRRIRDSLIKNAIQGKVEIDLNPCVGLYFLRVTDAGKAIENRKLICFDK